MIEQYKVKGNVKFILTEVFNVFWLKYDLDTSTTCLKFDPTGVQTYDLQIMIGHLMLLRRLL